jgi:hypothetical protein
VAAFPSYQAQFNISADHSNDGNTAALVDSLRQMEQVAVRFASSAVSAPLATPGAYPAIVLAFNISIDHSNGSTGSDATAANVDSLDMIRAELAQFATGAVTMVQV